MIRPSPYFSRREPRGGSGWGLNPARAASLPAALRSSAVSRSGSRSCTFDASDLRLSFCSSLIALSSSVVVDQPGAERRRALGGGTLPKPDDFLVQRKPTLGRLRLLQRELLLRLGQIL